VKAIDLYSGVGGWSLGLRMAGVEVVRSYEWWPEANLTNAKNNLHEVECVDIRNAPLSMFPSVDFVVGSPPCTHFSLANRGGKGNIMEGLKDVEKFLEIVIHLKPKFWALENVPRLAGILSEEFNQGGYLHRFCCLNPEMMVVDSSEWGVPQKRQRLIVGNFDFDLLSSYRTSCVRTLGNVIESLSKSPPTDPVYGTVFGEVSDNDEEQSLSPEEERINRDAKTHHPVYNNMSFPDDPSRPSRTITATCTRVSRESIVVPCGSGFRRLTLRERASVQSFPLGYQFYGNTHSQKQKMIGNAVPPLLAYYVAHAMLGTSPSNLISPSRSISVFSPPEESVRRTPPDKPGFSFSPERKFRFAIPNLRFKSGVRFELCNSFPSCGWGVRFFYGGAKKIQEINLDKDLIEEMEMVKGVKKFVTKSQKHIVESGGVFNKMDSVNLQKVWSHLEEGAHPFDLLDSIGSVVARLVSEIPEGLAESVVSGVLKSRSNPSGYKKLIRNSDFVFVGLVVCSLVNEMFSGNLFSMEP